MKIKLSHVLLSAGLAGLAPAVFADDDSSSDASGGFAATVEASEAVIIQVPINAAGEELTDAAELRVYQGEALAADGDFETAFADAAPAADQPEFDVNADSSTSDYSYGWRPYRHHGWYSDYYSHYRPTYYHYGHSWDYYSPYYRSYHHHHHSPYYGYRYYYYRRC